MAEQTKTTRDILKEESKTEFLKRTRAEMEELAEGLGIEKPDTLGNKEELYNAMVEAADLPDPSLRGTSDIDSPVAVTWDTAEQMWAEAKENGEKPRRVDVVNAAIEKGVAYYTARTQYQAWFTHTNGGEKLIADGNEDDLPRGVAERLGLVEPEDNEDEDADA